MRPQPIRGTPAVAVVHPRPRHPELRRGVRHHPSAPADGRAETTADIAVLRTRRGARRVLPRGLGLGTTALVRGERVAARALRHPGPQRVGSTVLAPDRRRRGARDARRCRDVRRHAAQADRRRGRRGGCIP